MLENQTNQREVFIISLLFITLFQRATRARVILLQRLIFRRIQRRLFLRGDYNDGPNV